MADLDLTCDEVIVESCIEPKGGGEEEVGGKRKCHPPSDYESSQSQEVQMSEPDGVGFVKRGRKRLKRSAVKKKPKRKEVKVESKSQEEEEELEERVEHVDPIHTVLPPELRWKIFKEFGVKERLALRHVSKDWMRTIDSMTKLTVKVQGDSTEFKGKCGLSMKKCTLVGLQNPSHRTLFNAEASETVIVSRGICHLNFEALAMNWSNLTRLEICWRSVMRNLLFGRTTVDCSPAFKKEELFPNLVSLGIGVLTHDDLGEMSKRRILCNLTRLLEYGYPSMTNLSVTFVCYREIHAEDRHLDILLPFIRRHATSLQSVSFALKYASHVVYPPAHPRHILFCVPANLRSSYRGYYSSKDVQQVKTELKKVGDSPQDHQDWMEMLHNTRKLELAIMTRFLSWSIKHLDYFTPTISDYAKFFRVLEIMNVTMYNSGAHNTATQLDAKVFSKCLQLVELRVYRAPIIFHEDEVDPTAEMVNLHLLPRSIQQLTIDGIPVASNDILKTLQNLKHLNVFHYFQSQIPRRNMLWTNGIDWAVLQAILKHNQLKQVKVHVANQANFNALYELGLRDLSHEYGWNNSGVFHGYMSMYQISLSR